MSWLLVSLMSAALMGLVSVVDKAIIFNYAKSSRTMPLLNGITQTIVGIVSLIISGIPSESDFATSAAAIISGGFLGSALVILQRVLFTQEVSRSVPVTQSAPIFAAVLALFVLGESISLLQWGGITLAVLGSVLISIRTDVSVSGIFLHKSFYALMCAAFLFGASNVIGKIALVELPLLYTHGLRMLAVGLILLFFSFRSESWVDVRSLFSRRSPALLLVAINDLLIAQAGVLALLWALSLGPASLVSAVAGIRALFTVSYSMGITKVWAGALGEESSTSSTLNKLFSTVVIVAGVAAIAI